MHLRTTKIVTATLVFLCLQASAVHAEWRNDFDDMVAISEDGFISVTCPPPDAYWMGGRIEVFFDKAAPDAPTSSFSFLFDDGYEIAWNENMGGELYVGPMMGVEGNSEKVIGHYARISFETHRAATGNWIHINESLMKNRLVTVVVNGAKYGPVSLSGSSKALKHITYLTPPC